MLSLLTLVGNVHYRFSGTLRRSSVAWPAASAASFSPSAYLGGEFDDEFPLLFDGGQRVVPHRGPKMRPITADQTHTRCTAK